MTLQQRNSIVANLLPKLAAIAYNELEDNTVMCNFTDVELEVLVSMYKLGAISNLEKFIPYVEAEISKRKAEQRNERIDDILL